MKPFTNKHSIAAGSPLHLGGSGKSPFYQDARSGTRLTSDGSVVRDRKSGKVVVGGQHDASGKYIPKTKAQKASDWDLDPRNPKGSEAKRRFKAYKKRQEEKNN